ncbi:MAG: hypothetical protein KA187_07050 [Arenimonas sp.]|nr:hypothetical protein [Arenimonas sp.]
MYRSARFNRDDGSNVSLDATTTLLKVISSSRLGRDVENSVNGIQKTHRCARCASGRATFTL